jgi:transglutaminase/protease-like cytokinesis protein 3
MKKIISVGLLYCIPLFLLTALGQTSLQDFTQVDSLAKATTYKGESIAAFAKKLSSPFDQPIHKVRAIFTWISGQVSYDCDAFFNPKAIQRTIEYKSQKEYQKKVKEWERKQAQSAFYDKKGMCMNYTLLFREMCQAVGIETVVIQGRIKSSAKEINGPYIDVNHAWNAVRLDKKWQLLDLTLASGYIKKNCSEFVKEFRPEYFFIPPQQLIKTHLPKEKKWQLLESTTSRKTFMAMPYSNYGVHKFGVSQMNYNSGIISSDTTTFEIEIQHLDVFDRVVLYEDQRTIFPRVRLEGNTLIFDYYREDHDAQYLSIHFETIDKSYLLVKYRLD